MLLLLLLPMMMMINIVHLPLLNLAKELILQKTATTCSSKNIPF